MTTLTLTDLGHKARRQLGLDDAPEPGRDDRLPVCLPVVSIVRPAEIRPSDGAVICPALSLPDTRGRIHAAHRPGAGRQAEPSCPPRSTTRAEDRLSVAPDRLRESA